MIRIDKYLADSGYGTRSEVRSLIRLGNVSIGEKIIKDPGAKIDPDKDKVLVKGAEVSYSEYEYYMLSKPAGVVTATTDRKEKTVLDLIKTGKRRDLFPVGRLDKDTEGLLLITNDGELAHFLLSPKNKIEKTYVAVVSGEPPVDITQLFREGLDIGDDKKTEEALLIQLEKNEANSLYTYEVTIIEGRYHEIKRMFEAVGCKVEYLKRYSMGCLKLDPGLATGQYRELTSGEVEQLRSLNKCK